MIYLDNAATTFPKPEEVYSAMDLTNRTMAVNAGRGSYKLAREANSLIMETKTMLRELVKADFNCPVVLASSATVAMNQVIRGLNVPENSTIYVSPYEHNAVARTVHSLTKTKGIKIKLLPLNMETLEIDLEMLTYEFSKEKPSVVICTHISNVTGYILPIKKIFCEAKKYECITVLDSAQSLGLIDVDSDELNADIIVFAGHKSLYGPFGIGGFINVSNVILETFITGGTGSDSLNLDMPGGSENRHEAASCNIIAISGLNAALKNLNQLFIYQHERSLTDYLVNKLKKIPEVILYAPYKQNEQIGVVSFALEGYKSEDLGYILDEDYNIAVRTGYHCAPYIHKYLNDEKFLGTVRIGLGQFNSREDVDNIVQAIEELVE